MKRFAFTISILILSTSCRTFAPPDRQDSRTSSGQDSVVFDVNSYGFSLADPDDAASPNVLTKQDSQPITFKLGESGQPFAPLPYTVPDGVFVADVRAGFLVNAKSGDAVSAGCHPYVLSEHNFGLIMSTDMGRPEYLAAFIPSQAGLVASGRICVDDDGRIGSWDNASRRHPQPEALAAVAGFLASRGLVVADQDERLHMKSSLRSLFRSPPNQHASKSKLKKKAKVNVGVPGLAKSQVQLQEFGADLETNVRALYKNVKPGETTDLVKAWGYLEEGLDENTTKDMEIIAALPNLATIARRKQWKLTKDSDETYEVTGQLGSGGFGVVYGVNIRRSGNYIKKYAIKVFKEGSDQKKRKRPSLYQHLLQLRSSEDKQKLGLRHFNRQLTLSKKLGSDLAVETYGIMRNGDDKLVQVMERAAGTLEILDVKRGRDALKQADPVLKNKKLATISVYYQLADINKKMHDRGLVHRDIKPENLLVFVEENGNIKIKVGDLDLLKEIPQEPEDAVKWSLSAGTPKYFPDFVVVRDKKGDPILKPRERTGTVSSSEVQQLIDAGDISTVLGDDGRRVISKSKWDTQIASKNLTLTLEDDGSIKYRERDPKDLKHQIDDKALSAARKSLQAAIDANDEASMKRLTDEIASFAMKVDTNAFIKVIIEGEQTDFVIKNRYFHQSKNPKTSGKLSRKSMVPENYDDIPSSDVFASTMRALLKKSKKSKDRGLSTVDW